MSGYGWAVELEGVLLSGGDADGVGCLTSPPDGLGLPAIRTEDVTYPQRDGVRHFADWYEPRIITLENVRVCPSDCVGCGNARQRVRQILNAWGRKCEDVELVVFTPCHGEGPNEPTAGGLFTPDAGGGVCADVSDIDFTADTWGVEVDAQIAWSADVAIGFYLWSGQDFRFTIDNERVPTLTMPGGVEVVMPAIDEVPTERSVFTVERVGSTFRLLIDGEVVSQVFGEWDTPGAVEGCVNFGLAALPSTTTYRVTARQASTLVETRFDAEPWQPGDTEGVSRDRFEIVGSASVGSSLGPTPETRSYNGPYGILGRPRLAEVTWGSGARLGRCATLTLRFDAVDHRMYVLDDDGTPGSGTKTVRVEGATSSACARFPMCFPLCFDVEDDEGGGEVSTVNEGTECVGFEVCFYGTLTDPVLENVTTGETLSIFGTVDANAEPICVDTRDGTATQGTASRTHLVSGNSRMQIVTGENVFRLTSFSGSDDGYVEISYRDQVVTA